MTPNPFLTIWLNPRATIRRITEWNPTYCVLWLACLSGAAVMFPTPGHAAKDISMAVFLALVIVAGPLLGLVRLWIDSLLIGWTGRWIGGTADVQQLRAAVAWSYVPDLLAMPILLLGLLAGGAELFAKAPQHLDAPLGRGLLYAAVVAARGILGVWSLVTLCHTVAEVQGFRSAWRGLLNVFLAGLVVAGVLAALGLVAIGMVFALGGFKHFGH